MKTSFQIDCAKSSTGWGRCGGLVKQGEVHELEKRVSGRNLGQGECGMGGAGGEASGVWECDVTGQLREILFW